MDLKQYKNMIKNKLLNDVRKQIEIEHNLATGAYNNNGRQYEQVAKSINTVRKLPKKPVKKLQYVQPESESESESESGDEELQGGRMHHHHHHPSFVKHMRKAGHTLTHVGKTVGHEIGKEVMKEGVKKLKNVALEGAKDFMTYAPEIASEAGEVALEGAPLLLAAGMKKPKVRRQQTEKQLHRHALVRKLMAQHGCSLCEASSHIKTHHLKY